MNPHGKLSTRQHAFAVLVAGGVPPKQAYIQAGFKEKGYNNAYLLLQKPEVNKIIAEELENRKKDFSYVSKEYLAQKLRDIESNTVSDGIKLKAIEALIKLLGYNDNTLNIKTENGPLFILQKPD